MYMHTHSATRCACVFLREHAHMQLHDILIFWREHAHICTQLHHVLTCFWMPRWFALLPGACM